MLRYITSQFGHPRGFVGRIVGSIMAYENRERNRWIVTLLDIQPNDHMLEVGFGPGLAIQYVSEKIVKGFVAGIDASAVMVQLARKRNVSAIREGRANLTYGSVSACPGVTTRLTRCLPSTRCITGQNHERVSKKYGAC